MAISKEIPWGTEVEMMPGIRKMFNKEKNYRGIYLGKFKDSLLSIVVVCEGNKTPRSWARNFWRQKTT